MKNEYAFILLHHIYNDINVNAVILIHNLLPKEDARNEGCFMDSKIITIIIMIIVLHNGKKWEKKKHNVITV